VKNRRFGILVYLFSAVMCATGMMTGCRGFLPASGPSTKQVEAVATKQPVTGIQIVDISDEVARKLLASQKQSLFSETLGKSSRISYVVGAGDTVEVSVWEAPPATLFGATGIDVRGGPMTSRVTTFPEQMVSSAGSITIPFAGNIPAAGHTLSEIGTEIARQLQGKANQPQVLVRLTRNASTNVTVVGEVAKSTRMPLTPRGERLLDALAAAGGVKQPVGKMTMQVTRASKTYALPLQTIIRDPQQNILLHPGDVITALYQPLSFTILGATGKNEEVNFEAQGISLAQGLARAGGLQDSRSDARGVFIFRFESANTLDWPLQPLRTTPDGKVPVIFRADLSDPATFFAAQNFLVKDKDLLYVSNASAVELQKFLNLLLTVAYPGLTGLAVASGL
jgi:polysaccharide biosynthesis/export protein